ncbi:MAG: Macrolide export ATP-binding/permease protein MacB [Eubacteriales bacterium]|jgi:putative ABC transport system permease protein
MFLKENILLAIAGLKSNKVRALLTMLGIIIGIGSVIAIVTIGNALTSSVSDTFSSMGANNIMVNVAERDDQDGRGPSGKVDDEDLISLEQLERFQERYADQIGALSVTSGAGSGKVKKGRLYANVNIEGANEGTKDISNIKMLKGRFLNTKDVNVLRKVAVVSDKLVHNIFKDKTDPLGKEINIYKDDGVDSYTIVGVYKYEQNAFQGGGQTASDKDISTTLYIPVTVAQQTAENKNFQYFMVKSKPTVDTAVFADTVQKYFDGIYAKNEKYTCQIQNMESYLAEATSTLNTISVAVAAIAAIALLVGGIGVMNIMLVSVTERTREIGTRKALGARSIYIKMQFIVESIIICVIGGIIGVIFGIGLASIGVNLLHATLKISIPVIIISVGFSMCIGIFFGYYPASKAAKLDPIEALRYE